MVDRFILSHIQQVPLFDQLTQAQLEAASDLFQTIRFETNAILFRQGQASWGFMLIVSGRGVFTRINALGNQEQIGQIGPAEYISEAALFMDTTETATLRATQPMQILLLTREHFLRLTNAHPEIRAKLNIPQLQDRRSSATKSRDDEAQRKIDARWAIRRGKKDGKPREQIVEEVMAIMDWPPDRAEAFLKETIADEAVLKYYGERETETGTRLRIALGWLIFAASCLLMASTHYYQTGTRNLAGLCMLIGIVIANYRQR